jgi:hypothetical protein
MTPSILLLDCTSTLTEKFKRQGFDVTSGTIGFCSGSRQLPSQVYEKNIFIYDPHYFSPKETGGYIGIGEIKDYTPEFSLAYLQDHILRGATFLIFVNRIADDPEKQNGAYGWIPFMPRIHFTKDNQPLSVRIEEDSNYKYLAPIVLQNELKTPVLQKIQAPRPAEHTYPSDVVPLFFNKNYDVLGVFIKRGDGELIILPEYKFNEEVINIFLNRVMPKLYTLETRINLIDKYFSPEESGVFSEIQKIENTLKELNNTLAEAKERLTTANRNKVNIIKNDETAVLILNYYGLATQQEDVALFYLYKVVEALENKYGGEKDAKNVLGCNTEWNLIGRLANESYSDIRHAPKPGEKIKEWNQKEIKDCFSAAEKIITAYLSTLF